MTNESPLVRLITRYSKFLGGIDVARALRDNEEARARWLSQYLGVEVEPSAIDVEGEVRRIRAMYEWLLVEEADAQRAVVEAKRLGVPTVDVAGKLRWLRRRRDFLRRVLREIKATGG